MPNNGFEPRIVGFLCNWCSYQGADMAGTARMQYAPNLNIIRVNCSGRVDPSFILKAFSEGADGVLVAGCHPGDCHYTSGNFKTMRRMSLLERLLVDLGIEPELANVVSSAEAARRLIDAMKSPRLRIVIDAANLFETASAAEQQDIVTRAVDQLGDRIVMAHAKDRAPNGDFVAAGKGVLDYRHYLATLRSVGFDGPLVTHGLSAEEVPDVGAFLRRVMVEAT